MARSAGESLYPELWKGLVGLWVPSAGHQGITTLRDFSSKRNNGTLQGSMNAADWVIGKNGYALDFDGTDDYVLASSALPLGTSYSVSIFLVTRSISTARAILCQRSSSSSTPIAFQIGHSAGGGFSAIIRDNASSSVSVATAAVSINTLYHLGLVRAGNVVSIYLNGILQQTSTGSFGALTATEKFTIGAVNQNGNIDAWGAFSFADLRIYNRDLTPNEIQQTYQGNSPLQLRRPYFGKAPAVVGGGNMLVHPGMAGRMVQLDGRIRA